VYAYEDPSTHQKNENYHEFLRFEKDLLLFVLVLECFWVLREVVLLAALDFLIVLVLVLVLVLSQTLELLIDLNLLIAK